MFNQVILVGRLTKDPEIVKLEDGKKVCNISLAVKRSFKNYDGDYEVDFIKIKLWEGLATTVENYMRKGDLLVVKARLQTRLIDLNADKKMNVYDIVGERVTFLSSPKEETQSDSSFDDEQKELL